MKEIFCEVQRVCRGAAGGPWTYAALGSPARVCEIHSCPGGYDEEGIGEI